MFSKTKFMTLAATTTLVGALGLASGSARATVLTDGCADTNNSCTFEELYDGGTIQVNDKLFSDWVFDPFGDISPDFANIDVSGLVDGGLEPGPGLRYDFNGELKLTNNSGESVYSLIFEYTVDVLDPVFKIKDNTLTLVDYSISAELGAGGLVDIEEDVEDALGDFLIDPVKFVVDDNLETCTAALCVDFREEDPPGPNPNFLPPQLEDHRDLFSPQSTIFVITDILLLTDGVDGNVVELNTFEQRFSQVPEPGTLALFGIGLAGLGYARRRRKAAA